MNAAKILQFFIIKSNFDIKMLHKCKINEEIRVAEAWISSFIMHLLGYSITLKTVI